MTKSSLFAMFAALALSASAPLLADDGDAKHEDAAQHEGKEEAPAKGKKESKKGSKHAGHHHGEKKSEKNADGEKK